jgi:hypothetical protein
MHSVPGFRVRVFGWPETWRVAPARAGARWSFSLALAPGSAGRISPPFLTRTAWEADEIADGLAFIKEEIRDRAGLTQRRVFLVDEEPEDLEG